MDTPSRKIILQTKSVRVIHILRGRNSLPENVGKPDNILIERRERDGMGELNWQKFIELNWVDSQSAFGDLIHQLFTEMAGSANHVTVVHTSLGALPIIQRPTTQYGLGQLLEALITAVFIPSEHGNAPMPFDNFPFDNREGIIGMDISPALRDSLAHMFPGKDKASPSTTADLVRRLLRCAAQELSKELPK